MIINLIMRDTFKINHIYSTTNIMISFTNLYIAVFEIFPRDICRMKIIKVGTLRGLIE